MRDGNSRKHRHDHENDGDPDEQGNEVSWHENGTGNTSSSIDLDREGFRMETFQTYSVVSSILMGSSLGLVTLVDFGSSQQQEESPPEDRHLLLVKYVLVITGALSVVFGAYSTMVFEFISVYCKTCLGMGKDDSYKEFLQRTATYRQRGFFASWYALHLFLVSFVSWLVLLLKDPWRWVISGATAILVALISKDFNSIYNLATELVFQGSTTADQVTREQKTR